MSIILPLMLLVIIFLILGIMIYQKLSGTDYMAFRFDGADMTLCEANYDGQAKLIVKVPTLTGIKREMFVVNKVSKPCVYLRLGVGKRKPLFFVVSGELMARAMLPPELSDSFRALLETTLEKIDEVDNMADGESKKLYNSEKLAKFSDKLKLKIDEHRLMKSLITPSHTLDNRALANLIDGGLARKLVDLQDVIPELLMGGAYGFLIGLAVATAMGTDILQHPLTQVVMMLSFLTIVMYFFFYERRKGVIG